MTTRRVQVGDIQHIITTEFKRDEGGHMVEHVTLETPRDPSETQRRRALTVKRLSE